MTGPSCRVADCVYVAEPGSSTCAMHGALLVDDSGKLDQAAGQLAGDELRRMHDRVVTAGCLAAVALLVGLLALVVVLVVAL